MGENFSFEPFGFGGYPDNYSSTKFFDYGKGEKIVRHTQFFGKEGRGGFYEENTTEDGHDHLLSKYQQEHQQQLLLDFGIRDDLYMDIVSPPFQIPYHEELTKVASVYTQESMLNESKKENPSKVPFASLGILMNHGSGFKRLNRAKTELPQFDTRIPTKLSARKFSTEDILRLAAEKFIQSSTQMVDDLSMRSHPFPTSFLGLSDDETKDVELVQGLLASAEKVGKQQYDCANKLLVQCNMFSSTGNPVQRLVYYFADALQEKIDRETGRVKGSEKKQLLDLDELMMGPNAVNLVFQQEIPFSQVCQLTGMQAIIEHVARANKVHLIDLQIRIGLQCTILMQALAARSVELLKITAVGTKSKSAIEKTGERLMSFARSISLPFSFNVVMVLDMLDLSEDLFAIEDGETICVYGAYTLRSLISKSNQLESLMRVLRHINPCVMVFVEVEANHNSPVFVNRFTEALFHFGAYFDCMEDCLDRDDPNRKISESLYFGQGIWNILAAEGEERTIRSVNITVWRAFFARFGFVEEELSSASLYQASLVVKQFACGTSCSFGIDDKSLIIGWKGTPLLSLSVWKSV